MDNELFYPVHFLHRAYNILIGEGEEAFKKYCICVGMPKDDIERVELKANCSLKTKDLVKGIG